MSRYPPEPAGHVVVAPDKFRGSLTGQQVAAHVAVGLRRRLPSLDIRLVPVADGGDGTLDAVTAGGLERVPAVVAGPTGQRLDAAFARRGTTALVELADASGLRRLPGGRLDPMGATSRGAGELIVAALDAGCDRLVLAVGGSACTDGGAGMMQALGARLLDGRGRDVGPGGGALTRIRSLDIGGLHPGLERVTVTLASDVDSPLLGADGAAATYGPQKGASAQQVAELERGLQHWADLVADATGEDLSAAPGSGAAGGVGFAAIALLHADRRPGVEMVLDLVGFDSLLPGARLVITGEGSLDRQSLRGKAPVGVAAAAARYGVPAVAVAGQSNLSTDEIESAGLRAAFTLASIEPDPVVCMRDAARLLEDLAERAVAPRWLET